MLTDTEFHTEGVQLPHDHNIHVLCESAERNVSGAAKHKVELLLSPSASIEELRELLAKKLSTASACVHLQVLVRESNEYEPVTCGSVADVLAASNPAATTLTLLYMTESRYGCGFCTALCAGCCAGMCVGCCMADN